MQYQKRLAYDQRPQDYWRQIRAAEHRYATQLRSIARNVGQLLGAFDVTQEGVMSRLWGMLRDYANLLTPWAEATSQRMLGDVAQRDARAWFRHSRTLSEALGREVRYAPEAPIGAAVFRHLDAQVHLIRDIPLKAGRDMQQLALQAQYTGQRYTDIIPEIRKLANMTVNRATLIARTETAKASTAITRARSEFIGATHYTWHTARDLDVRPAHRKLHGQTFAWSDPPVAEENGERHHPGEFPNCRCFAQPLIVR